MKAFNSDEIKDALLQKVKNREVIRFNYDSFDTDDFDYINKVFNENHYKCRAYSIMNDEWVPKEIYEPSIFD